MDPDRLLREQFIGRLTEDGMTNEILREVTTLENIEEAVGEHMLGWVHRMQVQKAPRSVLHNIREAKDFDAIRQNSQKQVHGAPCSDKCKDCSTGHPLQEHPVYGKKCGECSKDNYFKVVCRSAQRQ